MAAAERNIKFSVSGNIPTVCATPESENADGTERDVDLGTVFTYQAGAESLTVWRKNGNFST